MKKQFIILAATLGFTFACKNDSLQPSVETERQSNTSNRVAAPTLHPKLVLGNNCFLRSNDKTVVITKSVSFVNGDNDVNNYHWTLPLSIDTVIIKAKVTVTGGFKIQSNDNIFIKGENQLTSVLFGTDKQDWAQGRIPDGDKPAYSAITEVKGATGITARVENIKLHNSRVYAVTFRGTNKLFAKKVYILNTRGNDYQSNSDGFVMGSGSVIDDCLIDTWDDAIKLYYNNVTVKNTTIIHNKNGAPFQLGWDTKSALTATIDNIVVLDSIGESTSTNQSLFCYGGADGTCNTTINVNKLLAPKYFSSAQLNMNGGVKKTLPLVAFKSVNAGCSLKLIGDNNQDFAGSAGAATQSNATSSVKVDKICSNSTNVVLGKTYSCATATGCSWD